MFDEIAALSAPESLWLNAICLVGFGTFAVLAICKSGRWPGAKLYWIIRRQPRSGSRVGFPATVRTT
jgi:hypothetical protein